jgi:capsular polysaccharide biosynthesis protein
LTAGDVYRALWRHKFVILALTALCVAAAWYVTSLQSRTYKASTLVRVQQRGAGNSFSSLDASVSIAETYAEIINSGALNGQVRSLVTGHVARPLVANVSLSAKPVPDLALIWISAKGRYRAGVAAIANAAPTALRNAARKYGTPGDQIVTVTHAAVPSTAISPDLTLNLTLALAIALLFNCGLVLIFEVLRDRLPDPEEMEADLGFPVLASIPTLQLKPVAAMDASRAKRQFATRDTPR